MRKFFGIGLLALLTTAYLTSSCSRDDMSDSMLEAKKAAFDDAFREIYGDPDPQHTWGFGDNATTRAFTRANPGETYPATHEYTDADGNVIAGANMNHNLWADPNEYYGGWLVPDTLTAGQKERVRLYFQANPNLSYEDPHYRHFFVQQVYTGGTSVPTTGNHESTVAANGDGHAGMTLNQLTVGEAGSHINNFNGGTCSPSPVLDNGSYTNNGTYHNDQITLMVNVYDTSCFGYHETNGSDVQTSTNHNDKMALVSAATIDAWAALNGNPGEAVTDKWNRSFMGFDYELLPECDLVMDSYARLNQIPFISSIQYAWDGEKVMTIGPAPESTGATEREVFDLTYWFADNVSATNAECNKVNGNIVCTFKNKDYTSINFVQAQGADWTKYDKVVFEFEGTSPVAATLYFGSNNAQISVGDRGVEIANPYKYELGGWETISITTGDLGDGFDPNNPPTLTIKKVTLVHEATTGDAGNYYNPTYLLGDADNQKVSFYKDNLNMYGAIVREISEDEMKTTQDGKTCLNLKLFQDLADDGYHPINSTLKTWVKWQAACDGYYSDWIVTLTEAQRIGDNPTGKYSIVYVQRIIDGRIFCEDLGSADRTDIDYNDVVFDAFTYVKDSYRVPYTLDESDKKVYNWAEREYLNTSYEKTDINLLAAGGTIDIQVAGRDVNNQMDLENKTIMANTYVEGASPNLPASNVAERISPSKFTVFNSDYISLSQIPIVVKQGNHVEELRYEIGDVPHKFRAPVGTPWLVERKAIEYGFPTFENWVKYEGDEPWYKIDETDWYKDGETYKSYDNLYHIKFVSNSQVSNWGGRIDKFWGNMELAYPAMFVNEENQITITLDEALEEGDQIAVTGYRIEDGNKDGTLYIRCDGRTVAQTQDYNNIALGVPGIETKPNTFVFSVPSGLRGNSVFQLSKDTDGAQIYITSITVIGGLGPQM